MLNKLLYYLEIEGLILFLLIIIILFYFLRKNSNPMVFLITLIMWFLNAYIIIILPYDIYLSNFEEQNNRVKNLQNIIRILYSIIYWSIFICSWILIPLLFEYERCGYFTKKEKILYSIRSNLLFYGIILLIGIILFIWAYFKLSEETKTYFMKNCYNFSYLYGFFFLILLLGYSIPKLPKNIYDRIFYKKNIKNLESNTKILKKTLDKINKELIDCYNQLLYISDKIQINKELNSNLTMPKLEKIIKDEKTEEAKIEKYEKFLNKKIKFMQDNAKVFGIKIKKINLEENENLKMDDIPDKIASLNVKLKENEWHNLRLQYQLQSTYNKWCYTKTIVKKGRKYKSSLINQELNQSQLSLMEKDEFVPVKGISKITILYYMKIHPIILFFFSIFFLVLGLIILFSEICIILPYKISIFHLFNKFTKNVILLHISIICSVFIFFLMSLYALLNMKLNKNYRLYGPRQTDTLSIIYFTKNFTRIIFPLCVNILIMINHGNEVSKESCLERNFGINIKNHVFVLFSQYSPLFLIVFVFLNICNIFSRLIDCFSFETINALFFDRSVDNKKEGYEYLMKINKTSRGELLSDSIMDKLIGE